MWWGQRYEDQDPYRPIERKKDPKVMSKVGKMNWPTAGWNWLELIVNGRPVRQGGRHREEREAGGDRGQVGEEPQYGGVPSVPVGAFGGGRQQGDEADGGPEGAAPGAVVAYYSGGEDERLAVPVLSTLSANLRWQSVFVYTVRPETKRQVVADVAAAVSAGALRVGEEAGLPLHRWTAPDLSAARIAAAHDISVRHLYAVLSRSGISLGDWIRARRLAECRRELAQPGGRLRTIAAIGRSCGFGDATHFSKVFKQAYGLSPRAWHEQGRPRPPHH